MSLPSYLRLKMASTWMVLTGSSASTRMALASLATLKVLDEEGMAGWAEGGGEFRNNSFGSMVVNTVVASSMLSCSQSTAHWALASTVMMSVGPVILSLR
jgi:hypothetical protein